MSEPQYTPIPGPPGVPLVGNIYDIESDTPLNSLDHLADVYGPIYRLVTFGRSRVFVSTHELVDEVCDEERFTKIVSAGLKEVRNGIHDGLFTAHYGEENWQIAHRILIPAFGPLSIRGMFDEMYDIASQLVLKWARLGPKTPIAVSDDFTRLTLDTIALCAMGTRFNSYYQEHMHPFVDAMVGFLLGSGRRAARPELLNSLPTSENAQYWKDIELLKKVAQELVEDRRHNPVEQKDLLNAMILGKDPKTGQGMTDDSIVNNMITFLIAGHETTSGTLSFLMYYLLKTPHAYKKAQDEVDRVIGRKKVTLEHLSKLPYINACIREVTRLRPTAPMIAIQPHPTKNHENPVTLGKGKYKLEKGEFIALLLGKAMRDPAVYGPDAEEFKPERMVDEEFEKLPRNAWKPFGNGMRGCIGRPFAWQEMLIVLAVLLQNFNFQMDDPSYNLRIKQTLTIKPKDFQIRATLREGITPTNVESILNNTGDSIPASVAPSGEKKPAAKSVASGDEKPMHVFFGSNTGTCEALAQRLASDAVAYGYAAEVKPLDSAMQSVPKSEPVVIITASYEGQPPDNAAHFFEWLNGLKEKELEGSNYTVFGCGHHDWQATFQRIPKEVDRLLEERGAKKICERGLADAASSDMFTDFDTWGESKFWPGITSTFGGSKPQTTAKPKSALQVEVSSGMRASTLGHQLKEGLVVENRLLTHPDVPDKRHIKFQLPTDMTYKCGDYLAVLPINPPGVVRKAIRRFSLPWDAMLRIQKAEGAANPPPSIPLDVPISASDILSTYVELSQPASKRDINILAEAAVTDPEIQAELKYLASSPKRFSEEIAAKRVSPLDLLIKYPTINLSIGDYLAMLPPMRVRQYSISSSPLPSPNECTITFSVVSAPALSASGSADSEEDRYLGVASNYLSALAPGERVHMTVRPSHNGFAPPNDLNTPMIMACAGSGLAPFRGFVMERAEKIKARRNLTEQGLPTELEPPTKAILYVGCRTKDHDDLYAAEFAEWEALGAVDVRRAFSRPEGEGKRQYVQDRMLEDRGELVALFDAGARVFVCGTTGVGNAVRGVVKKLFLDERRTKLAEGTWPGQPAQEGEDEDEVAERWFETLRTKERFATDVFT